MADTQRDVVSFGETMLRLTAPEGSRLEDASVLHVYVAGSESNTLAALARLQMKVLWLSALPNNPQGRHVSAELRRHGVGTSHLLWNESPSRLGTFYVEEGVEPLGLQVYYDRTNSACALIDPDVVPYEIVDEAGLLHLTGITPALSPQTREVFHRLLARAQTHHVPLSFDVNYRAKLWSATDAATAIEQACCQASVLFCTLLDAQELWGFSGQPEAVLHQMSERFTKGEEHIDKTLVLTLGKDGAAQLRHGIYTHEQSIPTLGTARFGSGDAFSAGFLYAYLNGPLYQELRTTEQVTPLTFGNALAALKRCIQGDIATITLDEVRNVLQTQAGRRFR